MLQLCPALDRPSQPPPAAASAAATAAATPHRRAPVRASSPTPGASLTADCRAVQGHVDVIELLLEHGADVNQAKSDGATPLFAAAQQ